MKAGPVLTLAVIAAAVLPGCSRQPPPHRIIVIANFHFVSREDFADDLRNQDESISDEEIGKRYAAFLDDVESVQVEQVASLRDLIRQTGVRKIYLEGVTDENVAKFKTAVEELPDVDLPALNESLKTTEDAAERIFLLIAIDTFRAMRLEVGAVGQLLDSRELRDVLPLDDATLMFDADPKFHDFKFDTPENTAREMRMVKRLIDDAGPVTIAILGGAHDLEAKIAAKCPTCRYERIVPEAYTRAMKDN